MGEEHIVITYETIFEILKQEKERQELQKLDESFFKGVSDYLKEKRQSIKGTLMSSDEVKKTEKQVGNIKKMLKELYDRREKKIVNLAIDKCKAGMEINTTKMLKEEKQLFDSLISLLEKFRKGVLDNILNEKTPVIDEEKQETEAKEETEEKKTALLRFLSAVPKFLGEDLTEYGPFDEEDIANLPGEIAQVLINKGRAEEIGDK